MGKFSRLEVIERMESQKMVPLFFHSDPAVAKKVLETCYEAGVRILEFTNRGDFAHEIFAELVKFARENLPDLMIGAGSVTDAETTAIYLQSGADFIISPILNEDMAEICNRRQVLWSPGCGTLTEIVNANKFGAEIVKVFPGSHLGPEFIKAVRGPCPHLKLMPAGGVSPTNMESWFEAGAVCVGMGSKLIKKDLVKNKKYSKLQRHVTKILELTHSITSTS